MAPLGLGSGFFGIGPTISSDNATLISATGTAVRVVSGVQEGVFACDNSVLQSTFRASFTIAFWIKVVDGQPSSNQALFGTLNASTCIFELYTDGKLTFTFKGNSDQHLNQTDAAVFADGANAYKHVAVTMQKDGNSTSIIYVDGAAVATSIQSGNEISEANHAAWAHGDDIFGIGALGSVAWDPNLTNIGTNADIAEFAIWNVALDADAVAKVEDLGVPTASNNPNLLVDAGDYDVSSNLVAYWKLNDYSGAYANESKSGNTGKLLGDSVFV